MIIGGWKAYYGLENNCKSAKLWSWDKKKLLFETLDTPVILYGCEVWGCSISRESWRNIDARIFFGRNIFRSKICTSN